MKVLHPLKTSCLSLFFLMFSCANAFSDFSASQFANQFNNLNNGQGFRYNYATANGSIVGSGAEMQFSTRGATESIDFSAYRSDLYTGGTGYLRTFCIEPNITTIATTGYAHLNYQNGQTQTTSGYTVKLGTAALYSRFASGSLNNFAYTQISRNNDFIALRSAIQVTMGLAGYETFDWSANKYLSQLLALNNDKNYWQGAYDPNKFYQDVGDFAVYAMNVYAENGGSSQDFIYVTRATYGDGGDPDPVPEPATILLWSLGAIGVAATSWRRHYCKKSKHTQAA